MTGPVQAFGDSAYGTGEALAALNTAGHTAVIKPWPLKMPIPGGFTVAGDAEAAGEARLGAQGRIPFRLGEIGVEGAE